MLLYDGYGDVLGMGRRERDMRLICELDWGGIENK